MLFKLALQIRVGCSPGGHNNIIRESIFKCSCWQLGYDILCMHPEMLSRVSEKLAVNMYAWYTRCYSMRTLWLGGFISASQIQSCIMVPPFFFLSLTQIIFLVLLNIRYFLFLIPWRYILKRIF